MRLYVCVCVCVCVCGSEMANKLSFKPNMLKSEIVYLLYSHLHVHAASQRHKNKDRCMNKRRIEDFFTIIFTSHFICKVCVWEGARDRT